MSIKIPLNSFVTSDTHWGHKRIMEYQPNRNFTSLEEHDEYLIDIWNNTVGINDSVFHLGDFLFYKKDDSILKKLNGKITLIKGNHDNHKLPLPTYDYLKVIYGGVPVVLFHYPISSWEQQAHASLHFHGHCHGRSEEMVNRFDVGVDTNILLRPYRFEELVEQRIVRENLRCNG